MTTTIKLTQLKVRENARLIQAAVVAVTNVSYQQTGANYYGVFAMAMFNYMASNKGIHAVQFGILFAEAARFALYQAGHADLAWKASEYSKRMKRLEFRMTRHQFLKNVERPA